MFYPERRAAFVRKFLIPAREFPEFDLQEIGVFADTFREFDEDNSGTIDANELKKLLNHMGQGCSLEEADSIVEKLGGVIDFEQFLKVIRSHCC